MPKPARWPTPPRPITYVLFTKRTDDPKLRWLELRLDIKRIAHRRNGHSFHAPILEVDARCLDEAWAILNERRGRYRVDDISDRSPRWKTEIAEMEAVLSGEVDITPIDYGPPHGGW
jgi:hypothetical protein